MLQANSLLEVRYVVYFDFPLVAQSVEQLPFKEMVVGSIPTERTRKKNMNCFIFFDTCPRRRHVLRALKTAELGSRKFCFDESKIIRDDIKDYNGMSIAKAPAPESSSDMVETKSNI